MAPVTDAPSLLPKGRDQVAAKSSDIRDWLREQGRAVPANGRLKAADRAAYEAAHPEAADDDAAYPAEPPGGPESDSAASAEQAPRAPRAAPRSSAGGWLRGGRGKKKARPSKEKRTFPRVPVNRLIEHAYSDLAWAAQGMPPLSRLLEAQAPLAGIVLEDKVRGTAVDAVLQPAARLEDLLDAAYGMLTPPMAVLAVMATAPAPGEEPSVAHKASFLSLRHSLLVMARVGGPNLAEIEERGKANAAASADVDKFIAYLFDMPAPAEQEAGAAEAAETLYASATYSAADAPV